MKVGCDLVENYPAEALLNEIKNVRERVPVKINKMSGEEVEIYGKAKKKICVHC